MLYKYCFWVKYNLENYLWNYVFLKSIVLWPYYIWLFIKSASYLVLHMGKCMNMCHGKDKHLWIPLIMDFMDLWYYLKYQRCFFLTCIIWEIDEKHFWQEMVLKILRILWIFGYWNILWNYLKVNYVYWIHLTCELLMWICLCTMILVISQSLWHVITPFLWQCLCDMWLTHLCADKPGQRLPLCMIRVNPWVCGWGCCS